MWILVIVVMGMVVYVLVKSSDQQRPFKPGEASLDIIEKRYAKGEITKKDYEQIKPDLSSK